MGEQTAGNAIVDAAGRHSAAHSTLASIGAIGSVVAASSCCLPILPLFLAAGFAGSSTFLAAARPYFLVASILFIGYGFHQASKAKQCQRRSSSIASALLWIAAVFAVMSIFFPQVLANASAGLLSH